MEKIVKYTLFIAPFFISLPLFISLKPLSFFFNFLIVENKWVVPAITSASDHSYLFLIPLSVFFSIFVLTYFSIKYKTFSKVFFLTICFCISSFLIYSLSFERYVNLTICFYLLSSTLSLRFFVNKDDIQGLVKNYLIFFLLFCLINLLSTLYLKIYLEIYGILTPSLFSHNFLGFEIYQYHVSVIAILNIIFVFCFYILLIFTNNNFLIKNFIFLLMLTIILILIILAARKTSFLIFGMIFLSFFIINLKKKIFNNFYFYFFIVIFFLFSLYVVNIREVESLYDFFFVRSEPYFLILKEIEHGSFYELIFGYRNDAGFGGYGNLFIESFINGGLLGLLYFISLFSIFVFFLFNFGIKENINNIKKFKYFFLTINFILIIFLDSFINLNFTVPYYYSNLFIIIFLFFIIGNKVFESDKLIIKSYKIK